jgi:hypothetical protein
MFQFPSLAPLARLPRITRVGFPHSEIFGSALVCQLPEAYRRLLRPSSPPNAKASALRPSIFHTKTLP